MQNQTLDVQCPAIERHDQAFKRTHRCVLGALGLAALLVSACDKAQLGPTPQAEAVKVEPVFPTPASGANTTVPPAESVVTAANPTPGASAPAVRSNNAMTPAQESGAMPMGGQNNDHSAPLKPEPGASVAQ